MSFDIIPTPLFLKEVKTLSKKYISLTSDLLKLEKQLLETPDMGEPLGKNCYKIRL
jgi:mRNA-degrading endonuclease RelE of RelBE toxin-antitoxin system